MGAQANPKEPVVLIPFDATSFAPPLRQEELTAIGQFLDAQWLQLANYCAQCRTYPPAHPEHGVVWDKRNQQFRADGRLYEEWSFYRRLTLLPYGHDYVKAVSQLQEDLRNAVIPRSQ